MITRGRKEIKKNCYEWEGKLLFSQNQDFMLVLFKNKMQWCAKKEVDYKKQTLATLITPNNLEQIKQY